MLPFSYTGLKIVHKQMIHEALEHRRVPARSEKQEHDLPPTAGASLARFTNRPAQNPEAAFAECNWEVECKAS